MTFCFTKISDVGTSNPIVVRLTAGLSDIIKITTLTEQDKQQVVDLLFEISQELIQAEKCALEIIQEIQQIETKISQEAMCTSGAQIPQTIESALSLNRAREFLKYSQAAFRRLGRIISVIFKIGNKEHKFWNALKALKKVVDSDAPVIEVILYYKPWYQKVIDLRDKDEHDTSLQSFLLNYEIKKGDGFYYLERPRFYDETKVCEFLKTSLSMALPFFEDLVLACLIEFLPDMIEVIEIPSHERDPQCPKRFRVTLTGHQEGMRPT